VEELEVDQKNSLAVEKLQEELQQPLQLLQNHK
jgi:hypothetical protein